MKLNLSRLKVNAGSPFTLFNVGGWALWAQPGSDIKVMLDTATIVSSPAVGTEKEMHNMCLTHFLLVCRKKPAVL